MPARTVIIGRRFVSPSGGRSYEYVLRADVPAARQPGFAKLNAAYDPPIAELTAGDGGVTAAELADIRAGKVLEKYDKGDWPGLTVAQIEAALVAQQATWQTFVNGNTADDKANPFANYGTSYDGAAWTVKNIA